MKLPYGVNRIITILGEGGYEAFAVGGCVRDMIMGKEPVDYDITTNALPQQIKNCFAGFKTIDTGIKHGTVTVVLNDENFEITTYRVDGEYTDNRRPDNVRFSSLISEDLSRRDFTVNAMAYSEDEGLVDLFDGEKDIKNKVIRCVGDPDKRFNEDGLRILRALRFASTLGFEIEKKTAEAIKRNKGLLKNLSAERVFSEFKKLVCGENAAKIISDYKEVIGVFLPEILPMIDFVQRTKYHNLNVFDHTVKAFEKTEKDVVLRLAALLHDVGKPAAVTTDEAGVDHFKGHAVISAEMAETVLKRLKADNKTIESVKLLILYHSAKILPEEADLKKLISEIGFEHAKNLMKLKISDTYAKAYPYCEDNTPRENLEIIKRIEKSGDPVFIKDLKINGTDIMQMGVKGQAVGKILNLLLDLVILKEIENEKGLLLEQAEKFICNGREK